MLIKMLGTLLFVSVWMWTLVRHGICGARGYLSGVLSPFSPLDLGTELRSSGLWNKPMSTVILPVHSNYRHSMNWRIKWNLWCFCNYYIHLWVSNGLIFRAIPFTIHCSFEIMVFYFNFVHLQRKNVWLKKITSRASLCKGLWTQNIKSCTWNFAMKYCMFYKYHAIKIILLLWPLVK